MRTSTALIILCFTCHGCAARRCVTPTSARNNAVAVRPAPTPAEAFERATRAMADGDETAWRRAVAYRSPSMVAEAEAHTSFASARLHRAVREHGVTGRR